MAIDNPTDTELLDFLESLVEGYGDGVICRSSTSARGFRLHETSNAEVWALGIRGMKANPTVRGAIIDAMKRKAQS